MSIRCIWMDTVLCCDDGPIGISEFLRFCCCFFFGDFQYSNLYVCSSCWFTFYFVSTFPAFNIIARMIRVELRRARQTSRVSWNNRRKTAKSWIKMEEKRWKNTKNTRRGRSSIRSRNFEIFLFNKKTRKEGFEVATSKCRFIVDMETLDVLLSSFLAAFYELWKCSRWQAKISTFSSEVK